MKSTIWLIYVSSIVIMRIQADVQEAETSVCTLCEDPTIPKCESTDNAKLDKQIDCKQKGCVIAEDSETNYVCILERGSMESSQLIPEAIDDQTQAATVLPVPLALQMVTTETTESATDVSKEVKNPPVEIVGNDNAEAEDNPQITEQPEVSEHDEAQQEHSVDTTDKEKEPQPIEVEPNAEQAVEAGVEEITDMQENAETTQVGAENVAVVQPVAEEEEEAAVKPHNGPQSPDYAADAPAINVDEANVDVESPAMTAEKPEGIEETEPQNTNDINEEAGDDDGNKDTLDTNKEDEQTALNGGVSAVMEHNDDSASPANIDEPEIPASNNAANASPTVIVDNISPPANTEQILSCYSCSSTTDAKCAAGPGRAINCQVTENKQNGCYTLNKADTNVTTRGCISELTNEGLKYCKSNAKQCILCYEKGCNKLLAPSAASQSNSPLSIWLGIISFMLITYMI